MKFLPFLFVILAAFPLFAQQPPSSPPPGPWDVDTSWPSVHYQVMKVMRIPGDRLLVVFRVYATSQAPAAGVQIGVQPATPASISADEALSSKYLPKPFSFESAVLTDESTQQQFKALKPQEAGQAYLPDEMIGVLHPNESRMLTVQFSIPPPLPLSLGVTHKQTIAVLFPKAVRQAKGILLPFSEEKP